MNSTTKFIEKANIKHNSKFDYSLTEVTSYKSNVTIICPTHGGFEQRPDTHLSSKYGCPTCKIKGIAEQNKLNASARFITRAREVHGDTYDYSSFQYSNSKTKSPIICPAHGEFYQTPNSHLAGKGCTYCRPNEKLTTLEFISRAILMHGDRYDYDSTEYTNIREKVTIICPEHGSFSQSAHIHLHNHGCPQCATSGFKKDLPGILYYLSVNDGQAYKIGITNRTLNERFSLEELSKIEVVSTTHFKNGEECYIAEQKIINEFKEYVYTGVPLLNSGHTEMFNCDVLKLKNS